LGVVVVIAPWNFPLQLALVRQMTFDKAVDSLKATGGTIVQTSLSHEDQAKLQAAIEIPAA
jgi:uncharacterized membrane protein